MVNFHKIAEVNRTGLPAEKRSRKGETKKYTKVEETEQNGAATKGKWKEKSHKKTLLMEGIRDNKTQKWSALTG